MLLLLLLIFLVLFIQIFFLIFLLICMLMFVLIFSLDMTFWIGCFFNSTTAFKLYLIFLFLLAQKVTLLHLFLQLQKGIKFERKNSIEKKGFRVLIIDQFTCNHSYFSLLVTANLLLVIEYDSTEGRNQLHRILHQICFQMNGLM